MITKDKLWIKIIEERGKMEPLEGKSFSITDPQGINTVIYQINKTEKEFEQERTKVYLRKIRLYGGITW